MTRESNTTEAADEPPSTSGVHSLAVILAVSCMLILAVPATILLAMAVHLYPEWSHGGRLRIGDPFSLMLWTPAVYVAGAVVIYLSVIAFVRVSR